MSSGPGRAGCIVSGDRMESPRVASRRVARRGRPHQGPTTPPCPSRMTVRPCRAIPNLPGPAHGPAHGPVCRALSILAQPRRSSMPGPATPNVQPGRVGRWATRARRAKSSRGHGGPHWGRRPAGPNSPAVPYGCRIARREVWDPRRVGLGPLATGCRLGCVGEVKLLTELNLADNEAWL